MSYTIEEESGSFRRTGRRHNGYYAGDFRGTPMATREQIATIMRMRPATVPSQWT